MTSARDIDPLQKKNKTRRFGLPSSPKRIASENSKRLPQSRNKPYKVGW